MTSIQWLGYELNTKLFYDISPELWQEVNKIFEQAKEMHKQEIIDAFKSGLKSPYHQDYTFVTQDNQEGTKSAQYYQEAFVSKGSKGSGALTEGSGVVGNIGGAVELPEQEISDEEIEKAIVYDYIDPYTEGFINGAKWYREQLKQRNG